MNNSKKVKLVVLELGPDYYTQIRDKLVAKGLECELIKLESFCLLFSQPRDDVNRLREILRKENDEVVVLLPFTTELFLEEPDLTIMFSGYTSWYDPERVKIIPYVWQPPQSPIPELKELKWTRKPDLSVGFLGRSHDDRKIVRIAGYLPNYFKQQLLKGRHLNYVYKSRYKKIPNLLAWMPCVARMEAVRKLEATGLKKDIVRHIYTASSDDHKNYQNHMLRNTYVLCPRGYENFSFRFYETLAYGRIPVLIDTDTVLPPNVNWDELCVRVPYEKMNDLENIIRNDYETKTESEFIERQEKAIKVMEELKQMSWLEDIIEEIAKAAQRSSDSELARL